MTWTKCQRFCRISTHTLTWSVTLPCCGAVKGICNFNSHAHVERDVWFAQLSEVFAISTHTLTWSVTVDDKPYRHDKAEISTHTLTWSVTKQNKSERN